RLCPLASPFTASAVLSGRDLDSCPTRRSSDLGTTTVYTTSDPVSGNGTYTASYTLPTTGTVAGTYTWSASYSGDGNNSSANDQGDAADQPLNTTHRPTPETTSSPATTLSTTAP